MMVSKFVAQNIFPIFLSALLVSMTPAKAGGLNDVLKGVAGALIIREIDRQGSTRAPSRTATRPSTSTVANQGPRYSRAEKREIQNSLNILGHAAGGVDGSFGNQTRTAIRSFQSENSFPVTGILKRDQFLAIRTAVSTLAGNVPDSERTLGNGEVRRLQKALKSLGYYSGTIDGLEGRGTARAVSQFLNDRGHDPYSTPVVLALSLATEEAGQVLPNYLQVEAAALRGEGQTIAAGKIDTEAYEHIFYSTPSETAFRKALYLHAIKAYPDILDDEKFIEQEASGFRDVFAYEPAGYGRMNQLERENARTEIRERIRAEAEALAPLSDDAPWRLAFYTPVSINKFQDGGGLTLNHGELNSLPKLPRRRSKDAFGLEVSYSKPPQPRTISVARAQAEELWQLVDGARHKRPSEKTYIVTYVTVKSIRLKEANVTEQVNNIGSSTVEIVMNTDAIELHNAVQGEYAPREPASGEPLYAWSLAPTKARGANGSVLAWGRNKGFSVVAGHLVTGTSSGKLENLLYKMRLNLEPEIAREGQNFEIIAAGLMDSEQEKAFFGRKVYSDGYPTGVNHEPSKFSDEFARREAKQIFFDSYFDQLRKLDTPWPLPFVQINKIFVSEYDFDNEKFDLYYKQFSSLDYSTLSAASILELKTHQPPLLGGSNVLAWVGNWVIPNLPLELSAGFEEGRTISSKISKRRSREVYLGIFYTVGAPNLIGSTSGKRMVSSSKPVRVALFYDPELTEIIREFDLSEIMTRPGFEVAQPVDEPVENPKPEPVTYQGEVERILNEEYFPTKSDLWAYMYQAHPKLADQILAKSRQLESANEFERDDVHSELLEQLKAPVKTEIWTQITLRFGKYDFESGTMPITGVGVGVGPENWREIFGDFEMQLPVDTLGSNIEFPRDTAEQIVNMRNREVQAIARGRLLPGKIEIVQNDERWMNFRPTFVPEEVLLLQGQWGNGNFPTLLHRTTLKAAPEKVVQAQAPEEDPVHKIVVTSSQELLGLGLGSDFKELREALEAKRTFLARYGTNNDRARFEVILVSEDEAFAFVEPLDAQGAIGLVRVLNRGMGFDTQKINSALVAKYSDYTSETFEGNGSGVRIWQVPETGGACAQAEPIREGNASLALQDLDPALSRSVSGVPDVARQALKMAMAVEKSLFETETAYDCETVFQAAMIGEPNDVGPTQLVTMLYAPAAAKELKELRATPQAVVREVDF